MWLWRKHLILGALLETLKASFENRNLLMWNVRFMNHRYLHWSFLKIFRQNFTRHIWDFYLNLVIEIWYQQFLKKKVSGTLFITLLSNSCPLMSFFLGGGLMFESHGGEIKRGDVSKTIWFKLMTNWFVFME